MDINRIIRYILYVTIISISIFILLNININNFEGIPTKKDTNKPHPPPQETYELDYSLTKNNTTCQINVLDEPENPVSIDILYISIRIKNQFVNNALPRVVISECQPEKAICSEIYIGLNTSKPSPELESINVSFQISFHDKDSDEYLTIGDYFIWEIFDIDNNIRYNFSEVQFYIMKDNKFCLSHITIVKDSLVGPGQTMDFVSS